MANYNEAKMVKMIEWKNEMFRKCRRLQDAINKRRVELNDVVMLIGDTAFHYGRNSVNMFDRIRRMPLAERLAIDPKTVVKVIKYGPGSDESVTANLGVDLDTWKKYLRLCEEIQPFEDQLRVLHEVNDPTLDLVDRLHRQVVAWGFRDPEEIAV